MDNENNEKLTFEEFCEINENEITCILAESGIDREIDFDREVEEERLYYKQDQYKALVKYRDEKIDFLDQSIRIDDIVVFIDSYSKTLTLGKVKKLTERGLTIERLKSSTYKYKWNQKNTINRPIEAVIKYKV